MIRTLYVDDEQSLLELGKIFLEKSEDLQVFTACSAKEAFEMLRTDSFDVIVSDYVMPEMDGIAFLKELRHSGNQIPFIIFTGRGREDVVIKALDEGADLYLQKGGQPNPQFAELAHKIRLVVKQRQTVVALKKSEEKYRRIVETANEGIWVMDRTSTTLFVNERMATMIKYTPEEILGTRFLDYLVPEDHPDHEKQMADRWQCLSSRYERRLRCKDGTLIWTLVSGTPIIEDGKVTSSFGMFSDITKRVQAEQEVLQRNEELSAAYEELTATEEELRRLYIDLEKRVEERTAELHTANAALQSEVRSRILAEEALSQANKKLKLLSSITRHDINNQLAVLTGYLRLLQKKIPDPAFNDSFASVTNACMRISAMIQFTKEYEMVGITAPVWQDIRVVVASAAKDAPLGHVLLKNDLPMGIEVYADSLIVKVLYNLIDNAVRYGGKITTIRFSVEEHEGDRVVVCEDDGLGVGAEEKEKIFERGFGKNTGLGLALSREILAITGITLKETGEPGKGARFEMTVPKDVSRVVVDANPQ